MKWVECVPNFSEGRNSYIVKAIADCISGVDGVLLLHVDPGWDANRTVYTFAGEPEAVTEAAFRAIIKAAKLIDMRQHKGEHPRMGACDVCPLIPLGDMDMEATVSLSHQLGRRLGEAGIPVFMYEKSATRPERRNLAYLRKGEYEQLPLKLRQPEWKPDYGPSSFQERFGAMVLGARTFLIAFNVNLDTKDVELAKIIASRIRESGYRDANGHHHAGLLKGVKAIGWYMDKYDCAQVSTNIVDFETTGIRQVFDAVRNVAESLGTEVKGSELIGMIPEKALLDAGRSILPEETSTERLIFMTLDYLGLDIIPQERILEWAIREKLR